MEKRLETSGALPTCFVPNVGMGPLQNTLADKANKNNRPSAWVASQTPIGAGTGLKHEIFELEKKVKAETAEQEIRVAKLRAFAPDASDEIVRALLDEMRAEVAAEIKEGEDEVKKAVADVEERNRVAAAKIAKAAARNEKLKAQMADLGARFKLVEEALG